jgi:hypothetical protein
VEVELAIALADAIEPSRGELLIERVADLHDGDLMFSGDARQCLLPQFVY